MIRPHARPARSAVAHHYDELDGFYRELWGEDLHHGSSYARTRSRRRRRKTSRARLPTARGSRRAAACAMSGAGTGAHRVGSPTTARLAWSGSPSPKRRDATWLDGTPASACLATCWATGRRIRLPRDASMPSSLSGASRTCSIRAPFFAECRRVLRPRGRLVTAAWLATEDPSPWQIRHLLRPIRDEGRLHGLGCRTEYCRSMEAAGLHAEAFEDLSTRVRRTWTLCVRNALIRLLRDPRARRYIQDPRRSERGFARALVRIRLAYQVGRSATACSRPYSARRTTLRRLNSRERAGTRCRYRRSSADDHPTRARSNWVRRSRTADHPAAVQ